MEPFNILIKEGDHITEKTKVAEMDIDAIKKACKEPDVINVIINMDQYKMSAIKKIIRKLSMEIH